MFGIPAFNMTGFGGIGSISQAIGALDENLQFTDNLSLVKGSHNIRAGFQISRQDYFQITNFSGNPTFTFDGRYTGLQANGIGLADFLLGVRRARAAPSATPSRTCAPPTGRLHPGRLAHLPELDLNYGLRYEFARSPVESDNKSLVFAPELGQILLAGQGVRPDIVDPDWNNFAPRLGFTWRPPVARRTSSCAAAPASTTRPTISTRSSSRAPARRSSRRRRSKAIRARRTCSCATCCRRSPTRPT